MYFDYTKEERALLDETEASFLAEVEGLRETIEKLSGGTFEESEECKALGDAPKDPESRRKYQDEKNRAFLAWHKSRPEGYHEAVKRLLKIEDSHAAKVRAIFRNAEKRAFNELAGDPDRIIKNAEENAEKVLKSFADEYCRDPELTRGYMLPILIKPDRRGSKDEALWPSEVLRYIKENVITLHYDALASRPADLKRLNDVVAEAVYSSRFTQPGGLAAYRREQQKGLIELGELKPWILAEIESEAEPDYKNLAFVPGDNAPEGKTNLADHFNEFGRPRTDIARAIMEKAQQRRADSQSRIEKTWLTSGDHALKAFHNAATDALAYKTSKNIEKIDALAGGAGIIRRGQAEVGIADYERLNAVLGVSTSKLLLTGLSVFAHNNLSSPGEPDRVDTMVIIPFDEYAQLIGYDIKERPCETKEEQRKEKQRVKDEKKNAKKKVVKDLKLLLACRVTWEEKIKGQTECYSGINYFSQTDLTRNNEIILDFSPPMAKALLKRNTIQPIPRSIMLIDDRDPNGFHIALKLIDYYHIDRNQKRGTADRLSVKALLAVTDLPSFEHVQKKDRGHWEVRIKEPFESALDRLKNAGILKDWEYAKEKGEQLKNEDAYAITSFQIFEALYIKFELSETAVDTERIQRNIEKEKAASKKKNSAKKRE